MAPIHNDHPPPESLFHLATITQYVPLPPASLNAPHPAICASVFSPLLLSYYPPAQGIVLAYHDVKLSDEAPQPQPKPQKRKRKRSARARADDDDDEADGDGGGDGEAQHGDGEEAAAAAVDAEAPGRLLCKVVDEYAAPYLWATATFLVWRPRPASLIPARVTHQSSTHITLAHLNTFPVSVLKTQLPPAWTWHEEAQGPGLKAWGWDGRLADEGGWWVDGQGDRVRAGRELRVRVLGVDGRMDGKGAGKGFLRIEASLRGVREGEGEAE